MSFRPSPARHVSFYLINVLTDLASKQDAAQHKATAAWLAGALRKQEQEKEVRR